MTIDIREAHKFLKLLDPTTDKFTFQTFDDKGKQQNLTHIIHGTLDEHAKTLERLSRCGAGIFIMVNAGDLKGRSSDNVVRVRAHFADLDGSPLSYLDRVPKPHITVESSPNRYHAYWLFDDLPLDAERFSECQGNFIAALESDPKVKDLPRVMRLPGFPHQKGDLFVTRIISTNDIPYYKAADVVPATSNGHVNGSGRVRPEDWQDDIYEGEGRNNKITSLYGSCLSRGTGAEDAYILVSDYNLKHCRPPLSDGELNTIVVSINKTHERRKANGSTKTNGMASKDDKPKNEKFSYRYVSDIQSEHIQWLWKDMIPLGKLTIIGGPPKQGKSLIAHYIAATVSTGRPWDIRGDKPRQGKVVILSAEEDAADLMRPRLEASGADIQNIICLDMIEEVDSKGRRTFDITKDIELLKNTLINFKGVKAIIIDTLSSYFGLKVDTHRDAQVKAVLMGVKQLAEETGVAVIGIMHLNKSSSKDGISRLNGSIAFGATARANFLVVKDPKDEETDELKQNRLFIPCGSNVGPADKGLTFKLEIRQVELSPIKPTGTLIEQRRQQILRRAQPLMNVPAVVFTGETTETSTEALSPKEPKSNAAAEWLKGYLANGPKSSNDVIDEGAKNGYSKKQLRTAKDNLPIRVKHGDFKGGWTWELIKEDD